MAHSQAELVEVVVRWVNEQMRLLAQPSLVVDGNSSVAETDHDPDATLSKGAYQIDSPSFSFFSCISFILSSLLCFAFSVRAICKTTTASLALCDGTMGAPLRVVQAGFSLLTFSANARCMRVAILGQRQICES